MALFIRKRTPLYSTGPSPTQPSEKRKALTHTFSYNDQFLQEGDGSLVKGDEESITWIDVIGAQDEELIQELGRLYQLHPLTIQDIMQSGKRPHHESHEQYVSLRMNMITRDENRGEYISEHVTFILAENTLITVQQQEGDLFEGVRKRIREHAGRVRRSGADYLLYALSNAIFLHAVALVEQLGEEIEGNDGLLTAHGSEEMIQALDRARGTINYLSSQIRPNRDALRELMRTESEHLSASVQVYLRDLYDTATQTGEALESYRTMVKDQSDTLAARTASRLNEVMKFLTIFSVIFIPLSLLAGIYGTNFSTIPTLSAPYGFYLFLFSLLVIAGVMILIFKRKKWL